MAKTNQGEANETRNKVIIIEGVITEARSGKTRFSDIIKNRISIKSENIPYDEITAFKASGDKLTPKWFKERTGFINIASVYDIPVKTANGREISFDDWLEDYNPIGSEVKASVIQKDGAVYPKAIKIIKDGEARDPFEDL